MKWNEACYSVQSMVFRLGLTVWVWKWANTWRFSICLFKTERLMSSSGIICNMRPYYWQTKNFLLLITKLLNQKSGSIYGVFVNLILCIILSCFAGILLCINCSKAQQIILLLYAMFITFHHKHQNRIYLVICNVLLYFSCFLYYHTFQPVIQ